MIGDGSAIAEIVNDDGAIFQIVSDQSGLEDAGGLTSGESLRRDTRVSWPNAERQN